VLHNLAQLGVLRSSSSSTDRLDALHTRVKQAFPQYPLANHASSAENQDVHCFSIYLILPRTPRTTQGQVSSSAQRSEAPPFTACKNLSSFA
jgi:hypothetical protein